MYVDILWTANGLFIAPAWKARVGDMVNGSIVVEDVLTCSTSSDEYKFLCSVAGGMLPRVDTLYEAKFLKWED